MIWTLLRQSSALQQTHHVTRQLHNQSADRHPLLTEAKFLPFQPRPSQVPPKEEDSSPSDTIPEDQPVSFVQNVFLANTDFENRNSSTRIFGPRGFSFVSNNGTVPAILRLNGFEIPMQEIYVQRTINTKAPGFASSDSRPKVLELQVPETDKENIFLGPRNLSLDDFAFPKSPEVNSDARSSSLKVLPFPGNGQPQLKDISSPSTSPEPQLQEIRSQTIEHSPKKDVEVFAPPAPDGPSQAPPAPMPPIYPQIPGVYPGVGMFPNLEPSPYNPGGDNPLYPSFIPDEPPFIPNTIQPPVQPTEEVTIRATEETTRPTEETTHRTSPTTHKVTNPTFNTPNTSPPVAANTPFVPKYTPFVPKYTPFVPKYTPYVPKNIPFLPRNTPYVPNNVPYTFGTQSTRYFNMYPPTSKMPKVPPPVWPSFTPRPLVNEPAQPAPPYAAAAKIIATSSTTANPSVEVIGEPANIEPKYKLAVVSDYQNYNHMDGSFGFRYLIPSTDRCFKRKVSDLMRQTQAKNISTAGNNVFSCQIN